MNTHGTTRQRGLSHTALRTTRRTAALGLTAVALTMAGLGSVPALSASTGTGECPAAAGPVAAHDKVTGLTVSEGTTPEAFVGEVVGVVNDAIAPDFDLVVVRLSSPEIDRVGIWSGMSGSPVYDEAGDLIGAVAYGLSFSPSPVAGVTPAAEMHQLLSAAPTNAGAEASLRAAATKDKITLPDRMARRLVSSGDASPAAVVDGMSRLPVAVGVSGARYHKRLRATLARMRISDARVFAPGAASADRDALPIVSGGNLAASAAYGDFTLAGVGTTTAVCGEEILAFGHPFMYGGDSRLTIHGADAVFVQEDSNWVPFKVANLGAPAGTLLQDRLAGLLARPGTLPATSDITSTVTVGTRSRTGTTYISMQQAVADFAAWHLLYDQLRVFDAQTPGSQTSAWTVKGMKADGRAFQYTRADRFTNPYDLVWAAPDELFMQLYMLLNAGEKVRISDITTTSRMNSDHQQLTIQRVFVRAGGTWQPLPRTLEVRAGVTKRFLVTLRSDELGTRNVRLAVDIPGRAGASGFLTFRGGNTYGPGEEFWYDPSSSGSFDKVLRQITSDPRNDQVVADLSVQPVDGRRLTSTTRVRQPAVVDGERFVELFVVGR